MIAVVRGSFTAIVEMVIPKYPCIIDLIIIPEDYWEVSEIFRTGF